MQIYTIYTPLKNLSVLLAVSEYNTPLFFYLPLSDALSLSKCRKAISNKLSAYQDAKALFCKILILRLSGIVNGLLEYKQPKLSGNFSESEGFTQSEALNEQTLFPAVSRLSRSPFSKGVAEGRGISLIPHSIPLLSPFEKKGGRSI